MSAEEKPEPSEKCLVIDFRNKRWERAKHGGVHCDCKIVEADEDTHLLHCKHCERQWSAFNWLFEKLKERRWLVDDMPYLRAQTEELRKEIADLKKQRGYLRARLKIEKLAEAK